MHCRPVKLSKLRAATSPEGCLRRRPSCLPIDGENNCLQLVQSHKLAATDPQVLVTFFKGLGFPVLTLVAPEAGEVGRRRRLKLPRGTAPASYHIAYPLWA